MKRFWISIIILTILTSSFFANAQTTQLALMGDCGRPGNSLNNLKSSLLKSGIRNLVLPGDNLYESTYENVWNGWKKVGFLFDVVAIGNHNDGYEKEVRYFEMPGEYYSKVISGARFIVLNSDNVFNVSKQMKWLKQELKQAREKTIFLVYHHPTFTITEDHFWFEKATFQTEMRKIFVDFKDKISAVIVGHDHISSFVDFGHIPAIVAGSGRTNRPGKPVHNTQFDFSIHTQFLAGDTQHWGLLELDPSGSSALVSFIRVADHANVCTARLEAGKMILQENCQN
jgi:hypothetical protein